MATSSGSLPNTINPEALDNLIRFDYNDPNLPGHGASPNRPSVPNDERAMIPMASRRALIPVDVARYQREQLLSSFHSNDRRDASEPEPEDLYAEYTDVRRRLTRLESTANAEITLLNDIRNSINNYRINDSIHGQHAEDTLATVSKILDRTEALSSQLAVREARVEAIAKLLERPLVSQSVQTDVITEVTSSSANIIPTTYLPAAPLRISTSPLLPPSPWHNTSPDGQPPVNAQPAGSAQMDQNSADATSADDKSPVNQSSPNAVSADELNIDSKTPTNLYLILTCRAYVFPLTWYSSHAQVDPVGRAAAADLMNMYSI